MKRGRKLFGFEHSTVTLNESPYLERWIVYLGPICLRLHKFYRGDDDRAPHDHPFWFITIPLQSYVEVAYASVGIWRRVGAWRPHYRPALFRHIVVGRADGKQQPFWTFVIAGFAGRMWGFWPSEKTFVPFTQWEKWNVANRL